MLAVIEITLGAGHLETLNCRNNLAETVQAQGKWEEMEAEHRKILALREEVLGPEHPHVFESCCNVALCLEMQHKFSEALEMAQRAEAGRKRVLGARHPLTKSAVSLRERNEAAMKGAPGAGAE